MNVILITPQIVSVGRQDLAINNISYKWFMIIVLATDDNFVQHCCVAMTSVLSHNKNVEFYIFTEGLTKQNEILLKEHIESFSGKIYFCIIDSTIACKFPMPPEGGLHISIATYYRLFSAMVLPDTIDKIIYMDCDMIVRGSLEELWELNLDNKAMGVVYQQITPTQKLDKIRLGIDPDYGYFNAGLLLINLKYWRSNHITDRLFSFIEKNFSSIRQHDQDVLNAVLHKEVLPISYKWNYLSIFYKFQNLTFPNYVDYHEKIENPVVVHFVSVPKPWDYGCDNPFRSEYFSYLELTPFKGWRPKFDISRYYKNVILPRFVNLVHNLDIFNIRRFIK